MVIHLGDVTPDPFLVEELLAGKEPVHQEMQCLVRPVQEINLNLTVMQVIPHELPDDGIHVDLCFRPYRSCLRPSRTPIGDREGLVEVSHCLSSIMSYQIDSQGTGDIQEKHPSDTVTSSGGGSMHV